MRLILVIIIYFIPFSARAEWILFYKDKETIAQWFVDPGTKKKNQLPRVWTLIDHGKVVSTGSELIYSTASLVEADCDEGKVRTLSSSHFSGPHGTGSISKGLLAPGQWIYPLPGSLQLKIFEYLCLNKF